MDNLPPVIVTEEDKLIAEATGLSFSEIEKEKVKLFQERVLLQVRPWLERMVAKAAERYG